MKYMIKTREGWVAITDGYSHTVNDMQKARVYDTLRGAQHALSIFRKRWPDAQIVAVKLVYVEC